MSEEKSKSGLVDNPLFMNIGDWAKENSAGKGS